MAYLLERITQQLSEEGLEPRTNAAREWLKAKVKNLSPQRTALMKDRDKIKNRSMLGCMYFYFYDPKLKDSLPYYDRFPLVIPIERYSDGFLGLNLHYIHPKQRIILLDKLSDTATNRRFDEKTKLRLSYQYLALASTAFQAMPCIKRYLFSHLTSRFLEIPADEWDIAALLPVEQFEKASKSKVYAESQERF